jgi:hypothetical protein
MYFLALSQTALGPVANRSNTAFERIKRVKVEKGKTQN